MGLFGDFFKLPRYLHLMNLLAPLLLAFVLPLTGGEHQPRDFDFADPSAPDFSVPGEVRVYLTAGEVLVWRGTKAQSAKESFLKGRAPEHERLMLYHSDGVTPFDADEAGEDGWDVTIEKLPGSKEKILYAGVMTPPSGEPVAWWPEDHWSRRTYPFFWRNQRWVMGRESVFGKIPKSPQWVGHNYGHHFITDDEGRTWMFYERVTEEKDGRPFKTEIFARRIKNGQRLFGPEVEVLKIPSKSPWPAVQREDGGLLLEGPRPFRAHGFYFISFSAGDYFSDHYGIHLAWSHSVTGPYKPFLNHNKNDLHDFGDELESSTPFRWGAARAAFFEVDGNWWALFHGIATDEPVTGDGRRNVFLTPVEWGVGRDGAPEPDFHSAL